MRCARRLVLPALLAAAAGLQGAGAWATEPPPLPAEPFFSHLTTAEGLPEDTVRSLLQDRMGFLWIGTQNGLARYDGTQLRAFRPALGDSNGIGGRAIFALHEDPLGCIWAGTAAGGLSRLDPRTERFTNYSSTVPEAGALPGDFVVGIASTPDSTLWVALQDGGLAALDRRSGRFASVPGPRVRSAHRDSLTALLAARNGTIFVGVSGGGLGLYDPAARTWRYLPPSNNAPSGPRSGLINHIQEDRAGRVWLATSTGLGLWEPASSTLRWYAPQPANAGAWENYLTRVAEDASGALWIGAAVGLYRFDPASASFQLYKHDPHRANSLAPGPVMTVLCDRTGAIWTGGWQAGVSCLDPWRTRFTVLTHDAGDTGTLDQDAAVCVLETTDGALWVGTGGVTGVNEVGRLNRRAPGQVRFTQVPFELPHEIRTVLALCEDPRGALWIGTDRGLWWLPRGAAAARRPSIPGFDGAALARSGVYAVQFDHAGALWVASFGSGLFRVALDTGRVTHYMHDPADPRSLSQNRVARLHCDAAGRMWVGTSTGGLNIFDPRTETFQRFTEPRSGLGTITDFEDGDDGRMYVATSAGLYTVRPDTAAAPWLENACGLADVAVASLARDASGALWSHTVRALVRCGTDSSETQAYDAYYGVPAGEMYFGSCVGRDGLLYFGSKRGLLVVDPRAIRANPYLPPVVITSLLVNEAPVGPATPGTDGLTVPFTRRIVLPHNRHDLQFGFVALQPAQPERVRYRYRLRDDDHGWRSPTAQRMAHYTNLPPATYVFEVQAGTPGGGWNPAGASLQVVIRPPWWRTLWARTAYVLLAGLFVVLIYRLIVQRERMRTALEVERAEARHLQELDQVKSRFFANISHEFRTPLTLILGPLRRLRTSAHGEARTSLDMIDRNARRLGELIEQLLDLSRLEAGRMTVRWQRRDVFAWLRSLVSSFDSHATDRGAKLDVEIPRTPLEVWFDADLVEKIVANLLSNAFKFTPAGGMVRVTVRAGGPTALPLPHGREPREPRLDLAARELQIAVANTGSFIPPADLARVFERFHQLPEGLALGGTGIGLALTKELVELLGGRITADSDRDRGTQFAVVLPAYASAPGDAVDAPVAAPMLATEAAEEAPGRGAAEPDIMLAAASVESPPEHGDKEEHDGARPRVLVVEDNADLRAFLAAELGDAYDVLQAADGDAGLATAVEELPDLVLSDVIMPGLGGIELCRRLKADERTDHIPVVLLSARTEVESRLAGLGSGADDYQPKPFDPRELRLRVRNLIDERRRMRERYARQVALLGPAAMPVTSAEERFLKRAREIIDNHIDDGEFSVEQLAQQIGMSKAQLLRKTRAVTGAAPRDLIRTHRLQRAAQLLESGYGNVTEVALAVGMGSLSTFAKRFREQYGMAPSEYAGREN